MKPLMGFVKNTLVGGLLIVLPVWVIMLLLLKAIKGVLGLLRPMAKLLSRSVVHEDLVAIGLLVLICFLVGLVIRTQFGHRLRQWLARHVFEPIPGFSLVRSMVRQLAGDKDEQSFQPALAEIEEALVPSFIV